jgi:hypothetical protein
MTLRRIPCGTPGAIYHRMVPSVAFKKPKNKFRRILLYLR